MEKVKYTSYSKWNVVKKEKRNIIFRRMEQVELKANTMREYKNRDARKKEETRWLKGT